MKPRPIEDIIEEMRTPHPEHRYYAITLTANERNNMEWSVHSHFAGFADPENRTEYRAASLVKPDAMLRIWNRIGEPGVVVDTLDALWLFLFVLGGHALVEEHIAANYIPDFIKTVQTVQTGFVGFKSIENADKDTLFRRAPTPKHRMRILKRDAARCRICGRSPATNTDIELDLHHIQPWSERGTTHDTNLVTLCHTCHRGLDPHHDHTLFDLIGVGLGSIALDRQTYADGVRRYRNKVAKLREQHKKP
ncbi:HNH endonuclease [Sorangium cellulosum]|uniref:HNH endonuclease n=1 Tax=Sorangium cellulosum TaxID=56 RepID=UPI0009B8A4E9|nr:HNH endonuclease signature motif containing protein [Sorangium cellulosum]